VIKKKWYGVGICVGASVSRGLGRVGKHGTATELCCWKVGGALPGDHAIESSVF
jgi:hypothetical protein